MQAMDASDEQLWEACRRLDSDWEPVGQRKWDGAREARHDCATCCWFLELFRNWPDWGVCANPGSQRAGLLTHWEQGCWQFEPEKGERREEPLRVRGGPLNCFERALRDQAGSFIEQQVRLANDPSPEDEPPAVPEDIRRTYLYILLRRLLRRGGFRRQDVDEAAARARWDSSRYWGYARRYWARTLGEDVSAIRLPMNTWELEEQFWGRVDRIIREALAGRGGELNGEETQEG